ncbi:YugN family protein [Gorillibacterium massiliense]|uniref:YugN family protein n=1 Tax=Gorillibacterium massiliense TaxID=1280390 RepID=UPI0004AD108B|nr:YugN family protein [Gorillibacterium massiliense]
MIIENAGLHGRTSDLATMDEAMDKAGFIRWQWEYYRATYDHKITDPVGASHYFLRINARVTEGKLENPYAILQLTDTYIGAETFPHGLDYEVAIPDSIMKEAQERIDKIKQLLAE